MSIKERSRWKKDTDEPTLCRQTHLVLQRVRCNTTNTGSWFKVSFTTPNTLWWSPISYLLGLTMHNFDEQEPELFHVAEAVDPEHHELPCYVGCLFFNFMQSHITRSSYLQKLQMRNLNDFVVYHKILSILPKLPSKIDSGTIDQPVEDIGYVIAFFIKKCSWFVFCKVSSNPRNCPIVCKWVYV